MGSPMEDSPMEQEMSRLGLQLIGLLQRRHRAELARRYTEVLELEIAMESVHEALAAVADELRFGG
jgi:hypothetical protein